MAGDTGKTTPNGGKAKVPAVGRAEASGSSAKAGQPAAAALNKLEQTDGTGPDKTRNAAPEKAASKPSADMPAGEPAPASASAEPAEAASPGFARRPTISELKEKIMATANPDFTQPINQAFGEFQNRARDAYEQSTAALHEATEFAKGNVEALVESGKILAGGVQDLGKVYTEEAKSAYEALTADLREMAAVKSPTELFQLQSRIARRNFDALVATTSKNTEAVMKLATEAFAPISGRIDAATEKLTKAA